MNRTTHVGSSNRLTASLAVALCSFPLFVSGISQAGDLGEVPAARLRFARSLQALRSEIEKSLPASGGRLFSVSSRVFLGELYLPLGRSGLCKELFVLLPSEKPMEVSDLSEVRKNLAEAGLSETDQSSFHLENGEIRGRMEGIDVQLSPLTGISARERKEDILLLDPTFLFMIYRNEVKTPMVELAWKLMVTLREKKVRAEEFIVLDLPPADDVSLRYGYLPSLLGEMIVSPSAFAGSLPEKWDILRQAEFASFFAQYPESMLLYRKYLGRSPGDASACYKIAMMAVQDLDDEMALQWLNKAVAADSRFSRAFVEAADYLVQKKLLDPAERILRGGMAALPKDPRMATSLAAFYILRGQRIQEVDPEGAEEYFGMASRVEGADPAVREKANTFMGGERNPLPAMPR